MKTLIVILIGILLIFAWFDSYCQMPALEGVVASHSTGANDADATAFITATGITDSTQIVAIRRLVNDLKGRINGSYTTTNIWNKFSAIYPFIGGTSTTCSYNLKNTSTFQLTFTGSPTFDAAGYEGNTVSYAQTGLIPSTSLTINSTHISLSVGGSPAVAATSDVAANVSAGSQSINIRCRFTGDLFLSDQYSTTARASVANTTAGYFIASRYSSSGFSILKNGSVVATHNATNGTLPNIQMLVGGSNVAGVLTPVGVARSYKFVTIGLGLTDAEGLNLYNAEHFFNVTTLGR